MRGGWVKVYRQLRDHWLWKRERFTWGQAWIDLLLRAAHKDRKVRQGNQLVTEKRGQVLVSQRQLVSQWGWARNTIAHFLRVLNSDEMLSHEVSHGPEGGYTLITILNYERYQGSDEEGDEQELSHELSHARATPEPRAEPLLRIRKGRREKKDKDSSLNGFISAAVQYLNEKAGKSYKLTTKSTISLLTARARECFTLEDIKAVVDYKTVVWGGDPKMHEYLRPETLFGPKFESYLQAAKKGGDHVPGRSPGVEAALRVAKDLRDRQAGRGGGGGGAGGGTPEAADPRGDG